MVAIWFVIWVWYGCGAVFGESFLFATLFLFSISDQTQHSLFPFFDFLSLFPRFSFLLFIIHMNRKTMMSGRK